MTRPSDRNPEALLQNARSFLEHSSGQRELVLASLQRRLAEQGAGAGQASLAEGGGLPTLQRNQNALSAPLRARSGNASWPRLVSVGLVMGVAGFLLGRSQLLEPARVLSAAPITAADERPPPSAPPMAAPASGDGSAAALRAERVEVEATLEAPNAEAPRINTQRTLASAHRSLPRVPAKPLEASRSVPTSAAETTETIDLLEALARVRRAESERADGRLGDALATLDELKRLAPAELLREERLLERTLVECDLGNGSEAATSARELARYNPNSIYLRRLASSCAAP
jgi:hypothetical protein